MEANFWHNLWETNATGWHLGDTNPFLLEFFEQLELKTDHRIFIPLCGKTRDIKWLLDSGHKVVGAELNENAIQELFASLLLQPKVQKVGQLTLYSAKDIDIFVGDIFELNKEVLGNVDAIYDRGALVALPKEMRIQYTSLLCNITESAPQLLINFEYDQSLLEGPPFSITKTEIEEHYLEFYDIKLLKSLHLEDGPFTEVSANENIWLLN
ncbi:thiopurine S-methyltransferase [Sulfurovum sp.]|uniref:thiopurine S-methyltransferase n=1 Tax=Sulfurovum sp. TaxID=1969726 RepID=UPI002867FCBA|nr:thiopurine S-methyltransferase [Sulfurovum sp.]